VFKRIAIGAALGGLAAYVSGRRRESSDDGSQGGSIFGRIGGALRGGAAKVAEAGQSVGAGAAGLAQKAGEGASGVAHKAGEGASGIAHKVTGREGGDGDSAAGDGGGVDDVRLARKVETEILRDAGAPKGAVDVNVHKGAVQLRGEVERRELIDELVQRTREVDGVEDVESLLHLPGDPAPMHR
jgi:osmotically-inducible protein OsmY